MFRSFFRQSSGGGYKFIKEMCAIEKAPIKEMCVIEKAPPSQSTWLTNWLIDCEGKASSIAHISFTYFYPVPDDGRMTDRNMS